MQTHVIIGAAKLAAQLYLRYRSFKQRRRARGRTRVAMVKRYRRRR